MTVGAQDGALAVGVEARLHLRNRGGVVVAENLEHGRASVGQAAELASGFLSRLYPRHEQAGSLLHTKDCVCQLQVRVRFIRVIAIKMRVLRARLRMAGFFLKTERWPMGQNTTVPQELPAPALHRTFAARRPTIDTKRVG